MPLFKKKKEKKRVFASLGHSGLKGLTNHKYSWTRNEEVCYVVVVQRLLRQYRIVETN